MTRRERNASPRGQLATLKKVLNHIGRYRWLVLLSLALSAATVLLTLAVPVLVGGETVDETAVAVFRSYGYEALRVVKE